MQKTYNKILKAITKNKIILIPIFAFIFLLLGFTPLTARASPPIVITEKADFEQGELTNMLDTTTSPGDISLTPSPQINSYADSIDRPDFKRTLNGQFSSPEYLAVDSSNNVYIADFGNNRIQKFDSNGTFIKTWGSYGSGDGQFDGPRGIAVDNIDSVDYVYVADNLQHRIQKFDSNGNFIKTWGTRGSGDGQFYYPFDIAIDLAHNVYVTDNYNHRIQKFDSNGNFIKTWGTQGSGDGQFGSSPGDSTGPNGIAFDQVGSNNYIYVTDYSNSRIEKFDSDGNFIKAWGSYGSDDGQFYCPTGIAVDSSHHIYVTDMCNSGIQKFDSDGIFISKIVFSDVSNEISDYIIGQPYGVVIDSNNFIYVTGNSKVQKYDANGIYIKALSVEKGGIATINKLVSVDKKEFTWNPIDPLPLPSMSAGSGVIDGSLYVTGGLDNPNGSALNSLLVYSPNADPTWRPGPSMPTARGSLVSVVLNKKLYIIGGRDSNSKGLSSVESYDPTDESWKTETSMSKSRIGAAGAAYDGKIYVVGGAKDSRKNFEVSGEVYTPNDNGGAWSSIAPAPISKMTSGTAQFINGIMYVAGGQENSSPPFSNSIISYNPTFNTWNTNLARMPAGRAGGTSVVIDNKFYYIGGTSDEGASQDILSYDPVINKWDIYQSSLPVPLHRTSAQVLGDNLYIVGGSELNYGSVPDKGFMINKLSFVKSVVKKISKIHWVSTASQNSSVELFYSTDNGDSYTSLGIDSEGSYTIPGVTSDYLYYKAVLINSGDEVEPTLDSISFDYTQEISGTFTSSVIDANQNVNWTTITEDQTIPSGTNISLSTRSGSTPSPDENWSQWQESSGDIMSPNNRYIQIRVVFNSSNEAIPILHSISLNYQTISNLENNQIAPDVSGNATLNNENSEVVITNPTQPVSITINNGTSSATLDVSSLIENGTGILPSITINTNKAEVMIPAETTVISTDSSWNGIIIAPTAKTVSLPKTSRLTRTASAAVEIGMPSAKLSFNNGIRILLVSQAGKRAGYTRDGGNTFTEITNVCSSDSQVGGDVLSADGDCKIDVGSDLVIWSKHFTTFVAYTETSNSDMVTSSGSSVLLTFKNQILQPTKPITDQDKTQTLVCQVGEKFNTQTGTVCPAVIVISNNISKTLKLNIISEDVKTIQIYLNTHGYIIAKTGAGSLGKETNFFGSKTKLAVIDFQKANKLTADGIVGPMTIVKMK